MFVFDSYIDVKNSANGMGCYISMARIVITLPILFLCNLIGTDILKIVSIKRELLMESIICWPLFWLNFCGLFNLLFPFRNWSDMEETIRDGM